MPSPSIIQSLGATFQAHKQSQFTGVVHIQVGQIIQGTLYLYLGRLVWAEPSLHPIRRWHRQLIKHCPQIMKALTRAASTGEAIPYAALDYCHLVGQVEQGVLPRLSLAKAVEAYLCEVLFDTIHQGILRALALKPPLRLRSEEKRFSSELFLIVRAEWAWQQAQADWQAWQQAGLVNCSPNLAPLIGQSDALKQHTSAVVYQHLSSVIDGEQTFRDLSIRLNQPLLFLTQRTLPYIRQGLMGVVQVDDFAIQRPSFQPTVSVSKSPSISVNQSSEPLRPSPSPLIIYIDDSPRDSRLMGGILQAAGFRYRNIQKATHALPLLIEHKPQLIFLDLVMPVANGYEICSQVRRVSRFKDIPIVIVTSNDTLRDRVRSKIVGASGFLSKPIQRSQVLKKVYTLLPSPL